MPQACVKRSRPPVSSVLRGFLFLGPGQQKGLLSVSFHPSTTGLCTCLLPPVSHKGVRKGLCRGRLGKVDLVEMKMASSESLCIFIPERLGIRMVDPRVFQQGPMLP